jgi:hypothetical protein
MQTTFELQKQASGMDEKLIRENLKTLENIWNISMDSENTSVSFEYLSWVDLEKVRRELHELGYDIINDTHRFDIPESP